jgi:hypothetical protein
MARRWVFKRHKDQPMLWMWRRLGADGCIEQQAGDFENYGVALQDAIHNGFLPKEDDWVVENAHEVALHERGHKPLVILKQDPTTIPPGTVFATDSSDQYNALSSSQTPPERQ